MQSGFRFLHQGGRGSAIRPFHLEPARLQKWLQMRPTGGFKQLKASHIAGQEILLSKKDEQWIHLPTAQVGL